MAILTLAVGAASAIGGLFGGGADAAKLAERTSRTAAAYSDAKSGNIKAWWLLGAIGQVAPMPQAVDWLGKSYPVSWTSREWGSAYNSIVDKAARYYRELAPQYQNAATTLSTLPGPGTLSPTITAITNQIPTWVWYLAGAVAAYVLYRALKGR